MWRLLISLSCTGAMLVALGPRGLAQSKIQGMRTEDQGLVTSATELRAPGEARRCFQKGMDAWQRKDYRQSAKYLEQAVAIYPEYDMAYNNLGVMYSYLHQPDKSRAAFERSVQLNDKNANADRNLARLLLSERGFQRAEDLLRKSLAVDPQNPVGLSLLSLAEMESGDFDAALQDARRAHNVPHQGYALSHYVAGQALERKHQYPEARGEYQVYLEESPSGPEAEQVKRALARLSTGSTLKSSSPY